MYSWRVYFSFVILVFFCQIGCHFECCVSLIMWWHHLLSSVCCQGRKKCSLCSHSCCSWHLYNLYIIKWFIFNVYTCPCISYVKGNTSVSQSGCYCSSAKLLRNNSSATRQKNTHISPDQREDQNGPYTTLTESSNPEFTQITRAFKDFLQTSSSTRIYKCTVIIYSLLHYGLDF